MRKEYIKELEKALKIVRNIPLRHTSWNNRVYNYSISISEELKEERSLINKPVKYHEFYKNKLIDYKLMNEKEGWLSKFIVEDLATELEYYAKSLDVRLQSFFKNHYIFLEILKFDRIKYTYNSDGNSRMYLNSLSDFCIKGQKAKNDEIKAHQLARRINNEKRQESLFITLIDHSKKGLKCKKSKFISLYSKEDILNWEKKVEEFFEEGYTDMQFSYDLCLPYKPLEQYYYVIKNPKLNNWKKKLMKEIKEENK